MTAPKRRRSRIIRKRRQNFLRLLAAAGAALVLGLIPGLRWLLVVHLALDVALGLYVAQLIRWKRIEDAEEERAREQVEQPPAERGGLTAAALRLEEDEEELLRRRRAVGR